MATTTVGTTGQRFAPAATPPTNPSDAAARVPKQSLDKDAFLQLLVTQLKNQDPMNPADASQMAAQLAQFSTVEQLTNINQTLSDQADAIAAGALATQTGYAASLIGQRIVATGDGVNVAQDGTASLNVTVGGAGGNAKLTLTDDNGKTVGTKDLGWVDAGTQAIPVTSLPPGIYHYKLDVTSNAGDAADVKTYVSGTVDGLQIASGVPILSVNGINVTLASLVEVHRATP